MVEIFPQYLLFGRHFVGSALFLSCAYRPGNDQGMALRAPGEKCLPNCQAWLVDPAARLSGFKRCYHDLAFAVGGKLKYFCGRGDYP